MGDGQTGLDLIEDQHSAGLVADLAQALEVAGSGPDRADVEEDRLDDQRRDLVVGQRRLGRLDVIEREHPHAGRDRRGDPLTEWARRRVIVGAGGLVELEIRRGQRLGMLTVIGAFDLCHQLAPGVGASQAQAVLGCLGTRADEAHPVELETLAQELRPFDRLERGRAEVGAAVGALGDRGCDQRVGVTKRRGRKPPQ